MKIKKNLTLISLMLSVMMLVSLGMVSAVESINGHYDRPCDSPTDICTWTTSGNPDYGLPLGSANCCGCDLGYNTYWALNTQATATCVFNGTNLEDAMLYVSINNDIVSCTLNGEPVFGSTVHENCAPEDPRYGFSTNIYNEVEEGTNTLVCVVEDRGGMSHFDACVVGEYVEPEPEPCTLTITDPYEGQEFDSEAVPIEWYLSQSCTPVNQFIIQYQPGGSCNPQGPWTDIETIDSQTAQNPSFPNYYYLWDKPSTSGQYCIYIKVTCADAWGVSGIFNVDLAPPEVSLSVGTPQVGECDEEETGDCYVNQDTEITLTCLDDNPDKPWQSGVDYIEYNINGEGWTLYDGPFNFEEDSNHVLEYRCFDKVGKVDSESKEFIVDSVGPEFVEKTIGQPQYCEDSGCDMYVTQDTEICILYEDPMPHPVGGVLVHCYATVRETLEANPYNVDITLDENGCFKFGEDSYHSVYCWAEDALGNSDKSEDLTEQDIVDTQAPVTTLSYTGPFYTNGTSKWIDTESRVVLTPKEYPENHPVGLDKTYYRYEQVEDWMCYTPNLVQWEPTSKLVEGWNEYLTPFTMDESCHVIEYYSVDLLGNSEDVKHTFVFVDKTAPLAIKEVGKPSVNCSEEYCSNPSWDFIVTLDTVIELSCEDQLPHPSGIQKTCYRIEWDGEDVTSEECGEGGQLEDGYCCMYTDKVNVQFIQPCEHLLEFYCVDNVNKTSEVDSELFKVEGKKFELVIGKKWDLISVPFYLLNDNVEDVFSDDVDKLEGIWTYYEGEWYVYSPEGPNSLEKMKPGYGYWVKSKEDITLTLGGSLYKPGPFSMPQRELEAGWNLIGHYGHDTQTIGDALNSLKWSSIKEYNPDLLVQDFFTPTDMKAGRGYWVALTEGGLYMPTL